MFHARFFALRAQKKHYALLRALISWRFHAVRLEILQVLRARFFLRFALTEILIIIMKKKIPTCRKSCAGEALERDLTVISMWIN